MKPATHLRKAIQAYRDQHGATELGSYRDAVTDLLYLLEGDTKALKTLPTLKGKPDLYYILNEGHDLYVEEKLNAEIIKIDQISQEDLPLHIGDKWEFEDSRKYFEEKLKHDRT